MCHEMRALTLSLFAALLLAGCQTKPDQQSGSGISGPVTSTDGGQETDSLNRTYHLKDLQRVPITINGHRIQVWVMDDEGKRQEGMMWLTASDVGDNDGMIFAFPDIQPPSNGFWMKNTILALDITFISKDMEAINTQIGRPRDLTNLPASAPYQYVLEMKKGAAQRLGIKPGTVIPIPSSVKGHP